MKNSVLILTFAFFALFFSCKKEEKNNLPDGIYAKIETNKGIIITQLFYDKAPLTVANFITLAEGTNEFIAVENLKKKPFFNGLKFHRVIPEFMIQGGDPLGTGSGDTGYKFKDEINDYKFDKAGVLAMANSGPATNSSQFFITHLETPWLDGKHTIFGQVVENGMENVNKIVQDDKIISITILRNGDVAKNFDALKVFKDSFGAEAETQKNKVKEFTNLKAKAITTPTGLQYNITKKTSGKKPTIGQQVYIHYAGFFENGSLFDSSIESVNKVFGKFDQNRASQNGYQPIAFEFGKKDGLISGFIEGIEKLNFGDKATLFIPSKLGYGEAGAGGVIPPNANIIFEIELLESPLK